MSVITTMTLIGLFGLAMHLGYYWAAGGLVALFALLVYSAKRSAAQARRATTAP